MKAKLAFLDSYLSLWIVLAMVLGVALGVLVPSLPVALNSMQVGTTNIPLGIGLILMMYPPLAKVRYGELHTIFQKPKLLILSLVQNWIIGPVLMAVVAAIFLQNHPDYYQGLMLVGIARCIAMVMVWSNVADGDNQYTAGLVAFNAIFQVLFYPIYAWIFLTWLPPYLNMASTEVQINITEVAYSVGLYLGTPVLLGILTRMVSIKLMGKEWLEQVLLPRISPLTLIFLLLTIVGMFSLKADTILSLPLMVGLIALPLASYFVVMFALGYASAQWAGAGYEKRVSLAFTAAGNNFELGIAVAIAVFGIHSSQAFATVVGPLIEVPVLLALANWVLKFKPKQG